MVLFPTVCKNILKSLLDCLIVLGMCCWLSVVAALVLLAINESAAMSLLSVFGFARSYYLALKNGTPFDLLAAKISERLLTAIQISALISSLVCWLLCLRYMCTITIRHAFWLPFKLCPCIFPCCEERPVPNGIETPPNVSPQDNERDQPQPPEDDPDRQVARRQVAPQPSPS